jgi:antitoxin (DNA-binding transcriptional repressor) of toxin-antitoxin stability system
MKRYSTAHARKHLSDVLDFAEAGEPVTIERRGVRFAIVAQTRKKRQRARKIFDWVDDVTASGNWTWSWTTDGVSLQARRKKKTS